MNKAEYKKMSHDIRYAAFRDARYRTEKTGKKHTTRGILHNIMWWRDSTAIDKYGKLCYTIITVKHWKNKKCISLHWKNGGQCYEKENYI